jgi:hypothetical protein
MSFLKELVEEINKLRTNPSSFADKIDGIKVHFQGKILRLPNTNVGIKTQEGADAYGECAKFLRSAQAVEAMVPSKGLTKIANELLEVVQKDPNQIGSVDMNAIIDKYGSFSGIFNRVMECGGSTPEQVIINLLVSDGDKSRSQRDALLHKAAKRIGVASGDHDIYRHATIMVFCTKFDNTVDSDDTETYGGEFKVEPPKSEPKPEPKPKPEPEKPAQPQGGLPMLNEKIVDQSKPVIKQPPQEPTTDENVIKVDRNERVVVDGGKKKKKITFTKHFKDGHTEKEVKFENL